VPLSADLKEIYSDPDMCHSLHSLTTVSVRPTMKMTDINEVVENIMNLYSPFFPLEELRDFVMTALEEAVQINQVF
jgi:ryanodine receptor 2